MFSNFLSQAAGAVSKASEAIAVGNKVLSQYDVEKDSLYYSPELKWRIHTATSKERAGERATVFVFEARTVEKYSKQDRTDILDALRKDVSSLQRLRHPSLLHLLEPLCEERSILAFATRLVVGTLAQLLEHNRHELTPLERKCGLLDIAEALQFLHQEGKTAHLGISPNSVFLDARGKWLVGGFANCISGFTAGVQQDCPFAWQAPGEPGQLSALPQLRYTAPELTQLPAKCGPESDVFSLGLIAYELMSVQKTPLLQQAFDRNSHQAMCTKVLPLPPGACPGELQGTLASMLNTIPAMRCTVAVFAQAEFFQDQNVRALRFLEGINEKDESQRVTFLKGLPKLFEQPNSPFASFRVVRERIVPHLCSTMLFPSMVSHAMSVLIVLLRKPQVSDPMHFQQRIWPSMRHLFSAKEISIDSVKNLLEGCDIWFQFATAQEQQTVLMPFVLRCLELQEPSILSEVLKKLPLLHKKFDYNQVKMQVLPRMLQLLLSAGVLEIRVQVLMGISQMFEIFDKTTITDQVLVAFDKLSKTDRSPPVCMCLMGCYDAISRHLGHRVTAERILPQCVPFLMEESLSPDQYNTLLGVIRKLVQRVEAAREKEYNMKGEQQAATAEALGGNLPTPGAPVQDFNSLLFGDSPATKAPAGAPPPPTPTPMAPTTPYAPTPAPAAPAAGGFDLMGAPAQPAPAVAPNPHAFDPFASTQGSGGFDPFAAAGPQGGMAGGGYPMGGNQAMGGNQMPFPGNQMPPMQQPQQQQQTNVSRNAAYDPFAGL